MRRFPWLTLVVALVTGGGLALQETVAGTLGRLERSPAALHGEWWRWLTSLLVQDGHVAGGVFNVLGLLLCGVAAEQVVGRWSWLGAYVGCGLVGQLFGQLWQPTGGGNSVAVCGLAAFCVAVVLRDGPRADPLVSVAPLIWCLALASTFWAPLTVVGIVAGVLCGGPLRGYAWTRWLVVGASATASVALALDRDIHGGTLVVGLVVALALRQQLGRTD